VATLVLFYHLVATWLTLSTTTKVVHTGAILATVAAVMAGPYSLLARVGLTLYVFTNVLALALAILWFPRQGRISWGILKLLALLFFLAIVVSAGGCTATRDIRGL
jgi:hypothetical protein